MHRTTSFRPHLTCTAASSVLLLASVSWAQPAPTGTLAPATPVAPAAPASSESTQAAEAAPAPATTAAQVAPIAAPAPVDVEPAPDAEAAAAESAAPEEAADEAPFPQGETHDTNTHKLDNDASGFKLGKGLVVKSQDGDFSLETRLRAQFLYTLGAEEGTDGELGAAEQSIEIRRARLQFAGHFWGENNKFKVELAVSPRDQGTGDTSGGEAPRTGPLLDWYLDLTHHRDLSVRLGQYKVPFNRQRVISSGDLQLVDRSIVNSRFNVDRDLGFDIRSKDLFGLDLLKYYVGVFAGEGRNSNNSSDFGMMYLARVEVLPFGGFDDYTEADFERLPTPKASIGLGYGHLDRAGRDGGILGSAPPDGGTTDFNLFNADLMLKYAGFSLFSEHIIRKGSRNPGSAQDADGDAIAEAPAIDGFGSMVQAGYLFPETRFELSARVGMVRPLGDESNLNEEEEYGAGLSYYFAHHAYKLQADYFLLTSGPDSDNKLNEHQARVQLQAAY